MTIALQPLSDGSYRVEVFHATYGAGCMRVTGGSTSVGAPVTEDYCGSGTGQTYILEPTGRAAS